MELVPSLITKEDNVALNKEPTVEAIKKAVFELNESSVRGPDGLTNLFY